MENIKFNKLLNDKISEYKVKISSKVKDYKCNKIINYLSNKRLIELSDDNINEILEYLHEELTDNIKKNLEPLFYLSERIKKTMMICPETLEEKNCKNEILEILKVKKEKINYEFSHDTDQETLSKLKKLKGNLKSEKNLFESFDPLYLVVDGNLSLDEQIELYMQINELNLERFGIYGIDSNTSAKDENLNSNDKRNTKRKKKNNNSNVIYEFNNTYEEIYNVFLKYGIDLSLYNFTGDDKLKYDYFVNLICKFGNLVNIDQLLNYMNNKPIGIYLYETNKKDKSIRLFEILIKTLIYSSVDEVKELINLCNESHIPFGNLIQISPSILFNSNRELRNTGGSVIPGGLSNPIYGTRDNFIESFEFFKKIDVTPEYVFTKCPFLFAASSKHRDKLYKALKLYNVSDESIRKCLSSLAKLSNLDFLDSAIESQCLDYANKNLSVNSATSYDFLKDYKFVKYLTRNGISIDQIFSSNMKRLNRIEILNQVACIDINKAYGAVLPDVIDKEEYDQIIKNSDAFLFSEKALNNDYIKALDKINKINDMTYTITDSNNISLIISRYKVLRIVECLINNNIEINDNSITYALSYNSLLNRRESDLINETVKSLKGRMK